MKWGSFLFFIIFKSLFLDTTFVVNARNHQNLVKNVNVGTGNFSFTTLPSLDKLSQKISNVQTSFITQNRQNDPLKFSTVSKVSCFKLFSPPIKKQLQSTLMFTHKRFLYYFRQKTNGKFVHNKQTKFIFALHTITFN